MRYCCWCTTGGALWRARLQQAWCNVAFRWPRWNLACEHHRTPGKEPVRFQQPSQQAHATRRRFCVKEGAIQVLEARAGAAPPAGQHLNCLSLGQPVTIAPPSLAPSAVQAPQLFARLIIVHNFTVQSGSMPEYGTAPGRLRASTLRQHPAIVRPSSAPKTHRAPSCSPAHTLNFRVIKRPSGTPGRRRHRAQAGSTGRAAQLSRSGHSRPTGLPAEAGGGCQAAVSRSNPPPGLARGDAHRSRCRVFACDRGTQKHTAARAHSERGREREGARGSEREQREREGARGSEREREGARGSEREREGAREIARARARASEKSEKSEKSETRRHPQMPIHTPTRTPMHTHAHMHTRTHAVAVPCRWPRHRGQRRAGSRRGPRRAP